MKQGFRDVLGVLEQAGELRHVKKAVDPRHLSALAAQACTSWRGMSSVSVGVTALTVAVRALSLKTAISPKYSPRPSWASRTAWPSASCTTSTSPLRMM